MGNVAGESVVAYIITTTGNRLIIGASKTRVFA